MKLIKEINENADEQEMNHMIDVATTELEKIENDPLKYYKGMDKDKTMRAIAKLEKLTDDQFNALTKSNSVMASIKDNYDHADDTGTTSYISLEALVAGLN